MRIQNNIAAVNSHRQLGMNTNGVGKNLEKLSSGFRINRAGDDAAGLAISEKMRSQIKGLDTAQKNANDGISLVQTAEGALTEVHSMLNRMTELATQSANGTYDNQTDRANLQKEIESLQSEINRISESTNYNGINLLDGSLGGGGASGAKNVDIGNAKTGSTVATKGAYTVSAPTMKPDAQVGSSYVYSVSYKDNATGKTKTQDIKLTVGKDDQGKLTLTSNTGKTYSVTAANGGTIGAADISGALDKELAKTGLADKFSITTAPDGKIVFNARAEGSDGAMIVGVTETKLDSTGKVAAPGDQKGLDVTVNTVAEDEYKTLDVSNAGVTVFNGTNADDAVFTVNGKKFVMADVANTDISGLGKDVTVLDSGTGGKFTQAHADIISAKTGLTVDFGANDTLIFKPGAGMAGSGGLELQIGDTSDAFNKLKVVVGNMSATSLGIGSIDISNQDGASAAMDLIKDAINQVSATRGDLGAIQNRLEHTINNLGVASENMTAAEARIRDLDMAKEMMTFTKNNILTQASQAMLAQANQLPQGVLQLLQ